MEKDDDSEGKPTRRMFDAWYGLVCSEVELDRLWQPKDTRDDLLKVRADSVLDHTRLTRVMLHRRARSGRQWSLSKNFPNDTFKSYLRRLDGPARQRCAALTAGYVFNRDPQGAYTLTDRGHLITLSIAMRYFLYFMNMTHVIYRDHPVPSHVRGAAQTIAIRTMMMTEAMDFDLDPRGIVPSGLHNELMKTTEYQLEFITGHEYAHHLCNHLKDASTVDRPRFAAPPTGLGGTAFERIYNMSEQEELAADCEALERLKHDKEGYYDLTFAALMWLIYLDVFERASAHLSPVNPSRLRTHPDPMERYDRIVQVHGHQLGDGTEILDGMRSRVESNQAGFSEHLGFHADVYENYGSVYLDDPNTEWRGPELIDRVHY